MSKILVTGGYGLVGSEFSSDKFYRLSSEETDLRIGSDVNKLLSQNKFDSLIHCAGKVGGIAANMNYKGEYFYENVIIDKYNRCKTDICK